jgi:ParB/RepB/Spo0J family partition protein
MSKPSKNGTSLVPLNKLIVGKNVRTPSAEGLVELIASVKANGILQPLLVRPKGAKYELICGHRRFAAATKAGLTEVPVFARDMDDAAALAAQIVENLQREDSHALDEADAYRRLAREAKLDVATIAARVGRSVPYVYDRMRLVDLVPDVKQVFREGKITPGHAVVLARLTPADQKLAMDPNRGGLFEHEALLFHPDDMNRPNSRGERALKTCTVRELQGWVDENVRVELKDQALPDLFPETAKTVYAALEKAEKVVSITHTHGVRAPEGTPPILTPVHWKRADGKQQTKTCEHAAVGVIVIGPGRGESMKVCTNRDCKTHWAKEKREAAKKKHQAAAPAVSASHKQANEKERLKREREELTRKRFVKAEPEIMKAIAAAFTKASASATGKLGEILVGFFVDVIGPDLPDDAPMKRGKSAEDLVRYLAFRVFTDMEFSGHMRPDAVCKALKPFGVDVKKIVDKVAPKAEFEKAAKKSADEAAVDELEAEGDEE